jgi:hypothetical protein
VNQRSRQSPPLAVDDVMNAVSDWFISMATLCISLSGSSMGAKQTYVWAVRERSANSFHAHQSDNANKCAYLAMCLVTAVK